MALAQGFTIRRTFERKKGEELDDMVSLLRLLHEGKKIAYVHSVAIFHHTIRNIGHFVRKASLDHNKRAGKKETYGIAIRKKTLTPGQIIKSLSISIVWLKHCISCRTCCTRFP